MSVRLESADRHSSARSPRHKAVRIGHVATALAHTAWDVISLEEWVELAPYQRNLHQVSALKLVKSRGFCKWPDGLASGFPASVPRGASGTFAVVLPGLAGRCWRFDSDIPPLAVSCPEISDVAIIADDARLAAQLSCLFAKPGKYLPILEQPRLTRLDRDSEVIRCTNALARSKAKHFIFAALGDITTAALSIGVPTKNTIHVRTVADIPMIQLPVRKPDKDPLEWGKDRIGIGLLKALRARRSIVFNDNPSPAELITPKGGHLVVCEEGDEVAQVIAANYAFATGAGLQLIPQTKTERAEQILEEFYGINDNRHRSVSEHWHGCARSCGS